VALKQLEHEPPAAASDLIEPGGGVGAGVLIAIRTSTPNRTGRVIAFEQIKPDYQLCGCFRWSFASTSTHAGCRVAYCNQYMVGPPAENKTPRGSREQRGAKKYSRKKGVCGVPIPPMGPSVVFIFFFFLVFFQNR
jgi:hypothetical protein